jgi:hypothetical protein
MPVIRIPKQQWGKAWRAMIEIAPVRLVAADPVYEVVPEHIDMLTAQGVAYEVVQPRPIRKQSGRRATTP